MIEERVLSLDMSSKTGYATIISGPRGMVLEDYGTVPQIHQPDGPYPDSFVDWAYLLYGKVLELIERFAPDVLVIEETSKGSKNSYSQKILEFLHFLVAKLIKDTGIKSVYIMSEQWRREIGCHMSKEEKLRNKEVREYKKKNKSKIAYGKDGKRIGLIGRKHVNIRRAMEIFGDQLREPLKRKDEDLADALDLCACYHYRKIKKTEQI
jgi:Holliday junction resolvasome RuvABC endonuclease subunit